MLDENDIQKLLRLKRHEQPPAGYYEKFLQDFHRRQRSEMLREPMWKIALERLGAFFSDSSMGRLAYGTATAAVLLFAGVASYQIVKNGDEPSQHSSMIADNSSSIPSQPVADAASPAPYRLSLRSDSDTAAQQAPAPNIPQLQTSQNTNPHYIIDSRPVSYERPFSF